MSSDRILESVTSIADGPRSAHREFVEALKQQKALLELILETVPEGINVKDCDRRVLLANSAFYRDHGLRPEQVLGKVPDDVLPPEMAQMSRQTDRQALEERQTTQTEIAVTSSAGEIRYFEVAKLPLIENGKVAGIVALSRDVTGTKKTLASLQAKDKLLREQVDHLRAFVDNAPVAVAMFDREMRYLAYSRRWLTDYHLEDQQLLGRNHYEVFPGVPQRWREIHRRVLGSGIGERSDEDSFVGVDGRVEWTRWEIQAWHDAEGQIGGLIFFDEVITERKLAAEKFKQQEALLLHASRLSSMGEMVAGIAHEVNQPLYSILNYAKAVKNLMNQDGELDIESIRDWTDHILSEAVRGGQITKRMRSFVSRNETQRRCANINDIIGEALGFIIAEARDGQVAIHRELDENVLTVDVDRVQIQQVLVNLCKNAIEALAECPAENRRMIISTRPMENYVEVAVADNGPGISPEFGKTILEPFQTTRQEGIGLGLAISNTIVEHHRGVLSYHDNQHGGATFCFTLPTSQCEG